jgi:hypothetical protein
MEFVGSGARHQRDVRAPAPSRLSVIKRRLHLELLNRFRRRRNQTVRAECIFIGSVAVDVEKHGARRIAHVGCMHRPTR